MLIVNVLRENYKPKQGTTAKKAVLNYIDEHLGLAPEQLEENTTEDNLEENFTLIEDHKVRHETFTNTFNALREAVSRSAQYNKGYITN
mgnify:CR=1 FL=1